MTTPDELDRVISQVAGELTRADAAGFGERVQGRLRARASASQARQARIAWWHWVTVTAAVAIIAVAVSWRAPHEPAGRSMATAPALTPAARIATATEPSSEVTVPREAPRATRARTARPAPRTMSPAELAWLARAVPPLADAAPVDVREFGITSIAPRGVDLPALVIEPLGPRDINK